MVDQHLEKWWNDLERESLLVKWDKLVALLEYPSNLTAGEWHFDRDMLVKFDDVRINAVHHDGRELVRFDLDSFAPQLLRALMSWFCQVARRLNLSVPLTAFLGVTTSSSVTLTLLASQISSFGAK